MRRKFFIILTFICLVALTFSLGACSSEKSKEQSAGESAYEIYKKYNPSYNKSEQEWIIDLANGKLAVKKTVTFLTGTDDVFIAPVEVFYGEKVSAPILAKRNGYNFVAWKNGDSVYDFNTPVIADLTLTAEWENLQGYPITYHLDGGYNSPLNPTEYFSDTEDIILEPAAKNGCYFIGWFTDFEFTDKVNLINTSAKRPIDLYAKFLQLDETFYYQYVNYELINGEITAKSVNLKGDFCDSITLIDSCTAIGENFLQYNIDILKITLPDCLKTIGARAFNGSMISDLMGGKNVTSIGESAFKDCALKSFNDDAREKVNLPEGLKIIGANCFTRGNAYVFIIPSTVTSIGENALSDFSCYLMINRSGNEDIYKASTSRYLSGNYYYLGGYVYTVKGDEKTIAFVADSIRSLTVINLPKGFTSIASGVFDGLHSVTTIYIPSSYKNISKTAFINIDTITTLYNFSDIVLVPKSNEYSSLTENLIYYYQAEDIISNGVEYYVYGGKKIAVGLVDETVKNVVIDDDCTEIGEKAFYQAQIDSVVLGKNVKTVGNSAFSSSSLKSVTFNDGLVTIEEYAFFSNEFLTSVILPSTVESICTHAFSSCYNLETLSLSASLVTLEQNAFSYSNKLTKVVIPDLVTKIEAFTFRGCIVLNEVTLGEGVVSIGTEAFNECNIKTINNKSQLSITLADYGTSNFGCIAKNVETINNI